MRAGLASLFLLTALSGPAVADEPVSLLARMGEAMENTSYRGRFVYQHGAESSTLEIAHATIDGIEYERLTHLDGQLAELIRHGDQVICVHPDKTITRFARPGEANPLALQARLARQIPEQYRVKRAGDDRVAGRSAWQLDVVPADNWRFGYRLWLDQSSSLLLKSETLDHNGMALERLEYVSLEISPVLAVSDFAAPANAAEQSLPMVEQAVVSERPVRLEPRWLPAGFSEAGADTRLEQGYPVTARSYSDGLASFTLFAEPLAERTMRDSVGRRGPTLLVTRVVELGGDRFAVSLVGEVPPATAEQVFAGLQLSLAGGVDD
mgnify:CR=1 FL=1|jgi:sigma-E factor negative regulatory protein RseB